MTYTKTADRIIDLAQRLGYGLDIDFTDRKPISIKPISGRAVKFAKMEDALAYLETRVNALKF
jgi:hypothetical protein